MMQLDKDEMSSYDQRAFFEKKQTTETNPFTIFLAVLAAILVSWLIREAYLEYQINQVVKVFNQQIQVIDAQTQAQVQQMQLRNEASKAENERLTRIRQEEQEQQKIAKIQIENEKRAKVIADINERAEKDEAWKLFYKPTKGCEPDNPNRDPIKCGNDYIKAHNRFEATWSSRLN